jgi:hypothetical protein
MTFRSVGWIRRITSVWAILSFCATAALARPAAPELGAARAVRVAAELTVAIARPLDRISPPDRRAGEPVSSFSLPAILPSAGSLSLGDTVDVGRTLIDRTPTIARARRLAFTYDANAPPAAL